MDTLFCFRTFNLHTVWYGILWKANTSSTLPVTLHDRYLHWLLADAFTSYWGWKVTDAKKLIQISSSWNKKLGFQRKMFRTKTKYKNIKNFMNENLPFWNNKKYEKHLNFMHESSKATIFSSTSMNTATHKTKLSTSLLLYMEKRIR